MVSSLRVSIALPLRFYYDFRNVAQLGIKHLQLISSFWTSLTFFFECNSYLFRLFKPPHIVG